MSENSRTGHNSALNELQQTFYESRLRFMEQGNKKKLLKFSFVLAKKMFIIKGLLFNKISSLRYFVFIEKKT